MGVRHFTLKGKLMAYYKYSTYITQNTHDAFDALHSPGTEAPYSGIYRCEVCGHEAVSTMDNRLPPQNHHQHPNNQAIQWRLIVATQSK